MERVTVTALLAMLVFLVSCSQTVRVAPSAYETVGHSNAVVWKIRTTDARELRVTQISVVGNSFAIKRIRSEIPGDHEVVVDPPLLIPFEEVESLEETRSAELSSIVLVAGGVAVVGLVGLLVIQATNPDYFD